MTTDDDCADNVYDDGQSFILLLGWPDNNDHPKSYSAPCVSHFPYLVISICATYFCFANMLDLSVSVHRPSTSFTVGCCRDNISTISTSLTRV